MFLAFLNLSTRGSNFILQQKIWLSRVKLYAQAFNYDFVMADNDYILSVVIHVRRNITILSDCKVLNMDLASVTEFNNLILTHCYH